jgi:pimeloyl-ACP methyl ester carboxylesterase
VSHHPFHPIIYVRGFAATESEIEDTVADPYMGFNIGSTKSRKAWSGEVRRFYFESPLVRLMGDHQYQDVFVEGDDLLLADRNDSHLPYRCIVIYRYYDAASKDFGSGSTPAIETFARGLDELILKLREKVCADPRNKVTPDDFRVHLVAHSMGGLICRAFLQNPALGSQIARGAVDKLYTYATPHNGIDMRLVRNVPGWLSFGDVNNFNRKRMATYLALPAADDVSRVTGFPPERVFNLVGTNARDYTVMKGLSSWAAGEESDGLVRIENATTHGLDAQGRRITSPRAFVHRSHSGHYGIVNSEEGYQNLTRFLFGSVRADGIFEIDAITLPAELEAHRLDPKHEVKASYQFEVAISLRGAHWQFTRREVRENSAIFRSFNQLFPKVGGVRVADREQSPHLFSLFLDPDKSVQRNRSVSFAIDLKVLVPDYELDGRLFIKRHYEGGYILREFIVVEAIPDTAAAGGYRIRVGDQDRTPGRALRTVDSEALDPNDPSRGLVFTVPIEQNTRPGISGRLRIELRPWS